MSDLIDRQDVLDAFLRSSDYLDKDMIIRTFIGLSRLPSVQPEPDTRLYSDGFDDGYKQAIKDAQPEQRWTPCSERLPEDDVEVFVYLFDRPSPYIAWFRESCWFTEEFQVEKENYPKAWMPLPEPYRGE